MNTAIKIKRRKTLQRLVLQKIRVMPIFFWLLMTGIGTRMNGLWIKVAHIMCVPIGTSFPPISVLKVLC